VPPEWRIEEGYIENEQGQRIIDFKECNLHVVGYSEAVDTWLPLEELKTHIYTQDDLPGAIPYVTSYYNRRWGFCMSRRQLDSLPEGKYHAVIKSSHFDGSLTYGELYIPGESQEEIFLSSYVCHPSLANDNLSGPSLLTELALYLKSLPYRRYSYRLVLVPETIGAISYLSSNLEVMKQRVIAGFNLSCCGDDRAYSYIASPYGDTLADRALKNALRFHCRKFKRYSFRRRGSDERQYCAPGVRLPLCGFGRSSYLGFPEYHTSYDNLGLVSPIGFQGGFDAMRKCLFALEHNHRYEVVSPCEPQLGRRGLYPTVAKKEVYDSIKTMMNLLGYADGRNDLIALSERIKCPVEEILPIIGRLLDAGVMRQTD
ncbi:MAG: DUF4910 domain-containing protein, partial [Succinivibrio sp.]|nr:DUF4910 domain-containing protein [Succinivibrio sp.]